MSDFLESTKSHQTAVSIGVSSISGIFLRSGHSAHTQAECLKFYKQNIECRVQTVFVYFPSVSHLHQSLWYQWKDIHKATPHKLTETYAIFSHLQSFEGRLVSGVFALQCYYMSPGDALTRSGVSPSEAQCSRGRVSPSLLGCHYRTHHSTET